MRGGGRKAVMEMSHNRSFSNGLGERLHVDPVCQISDKDGISANAKMTLCLRIFLKEATHSIPFVATIAGPNGTLWPK